MPLKWKIYYWCGWILLLWSVITACGLVYDFFITHVHNNPTTMTVSFIMAAILISQAVFSIRLIRHVKKDSVFSDAEKKSSKVINGTAMVLCCLLAIAVIYKTPVILKQTYYLQIITNALAVIAVAAGIYLGAMHNKLKQFITSRYFASVDTIGNELEEQDTHT